MKNACFGEIRNIMKNTDEPWGAAVPVRKEKRDEKRGQLQEFPYGMVKEKRANKASRKNNNLLWITISTDGETENIKSMGCTEKELLQKIKKF